MSTLTPALSAFLAHKSAIDAILANLTAASEDHFNTFPDQCNWGKVGDLHNLRNALEAAAEVIENWRNAHYAP